MRATSQNVRGPGKAWERRSRLGAGLLVAALLVACESSGGTAGGNVNLAPVAKAGPAQSVAVGATVVLDATASTDANGDALTYRWSWVSRPEGSGAILTFANTVHPSFVADVAGAYVVQLVVHDGQVESPPATVTITAALGNLAPVASAGPDQNVTVGATVTLDGSASTDANGDTITYAWSFLSRPAGSGATLSSATSASPSFTADVAGTYVVQLVASDGVLDSAPDTVSVVAAPANSAPVAHAGPDQNVTAGDTVTLDGSSSSDADAGDTLSYSWTLTSKPAGSSLTGVTNPTSVHPTFVPDVPGDYVVQLIVNDGHVDSAPDTVAIVAAAGNSKPIASAGPDQNVTAGDTVTLDGTGSHDADAGDTLGYQWSVVSYAGSSAPVLTGATTVHPTFVAAAAGDYVLQLVVNDGHLNSDPDTVKVTAAAGNSKPIASAGPDQNVAVGATVTLDGSASSDADLDPLTYQWSFVSYAGSSAPTLTTTDPVHPTFVADPAGDYVLQLVVNDGHVDSAPDNVTVTAAAAPTTIAFVPTYSPFASYLETGSDVTGNNNFAIQTGVVDVSPIRFWNPASGRLRLNHDASGKYAINYNGSNLTASNYVVGGTFTPPLTTAFDRYISIPYTSTSSPVTVTVHHTNSGTCTTSQVLIVKADGTIVGVGSACGGTTASPASTTATFTDATNAEVFIAFSRTSGDSGERFWDVALTY